MIKKQLRLVTVAAIFVLLILIFPVSEASENISYLSYCMHEKASVSIQAEGYQSYLNNETITFTGRNTAGSETFFFIIGPYLPKEGARLSNPAVAVINNDSSSFDSVSTGNEDLYFCYWNYSWDPTGYGLDGTYTVYAVSAPLDKNHLAAGTYSANSIIIRQPVASTTTTTTAATTAVTTTPATTVVTTVPTTSQTPPVTTIQTTSVAGTTKQTLAQFTPWETSAPAPESAIPPEVACLSLLIGAGAILWKRG